MAGQGIRRREILRIMGTAAAAATFPGFSKWGFACGHVGNAALAIRPASYHPQFFRDAEYGMVERLAEMIIPSDGTPGATEAGVAEFIDFMVWSNPEAQYPFRMGLAWLNAHSEQMLGKKFLEITPAQQTSLLEPLGIKDKARRGEEDGRRFFALMREFTVTGFYTSEIGYKELDNPALKFYSESPECPHKDDREHKKLARAASSPAFPMATKIYDVIVIGTGAGGGMAIKTLCEAGLKVCALNAGRRLDPEKDFRFHRMPWDMKFHGLDDPTRRNESYGYMDNEYTKAAWDHEIPFTVAPGTKWMWPRCNAVGGKTNFWGRSSARFGDIDFRGGSLDGYDVDWPLTYSEIDPFYTRVEKMIGVASTVQNRPSNPDGSYLPPFKFRCLDYILEAGCKKLGVPYLPDRCAQLTEPHEGHPACHFCGECTTGCDVGAFFSTPYFLLPKSEATNNLELRTDALAKNILVDENGQAKGVAYIDRKSKQEVEVLGRAVVVAAGCVESARILLNSKSRQWPNGIANSSSEVGRNLCDHLYGESARGYLPQLMGQPSFPDHVADSTIAWMPRWQNLKHLHEEKFIRGYSVYPDGGCTEFPWYAVDLDGFGSSFKREIKRRYPSPVSFGIQAPTLRSDTNYMDLDPEVKDPYGIPVARMHFEWDENVLKMWEHSKQICADVLKAAGGELERSGDVPEIPGFSLHETGTLRMGNDPKKFVTNRFGQTHDVDNLYACDASVFLNCTDKTTTISILAFTLRTCEHLIENFRRGEHQAA